MFKARSNDIIRTDALHIHDRDYHRVSIQKIGPVCGGDAFIVGYSVQADNNVGYTVGWTTYPAFSLDRENWKTIGGRMGQNITAQRHHDVQSRVVLHGPVVDEAPAIWFAVFARAYSTASKPGDMLLIVKSNLFVVRLGG